LAGLIGGLQGIDTGRKRAAGNGERNAAIVERGGAAVAAARKRDRPYRGGIPLPPSTLTVTVSGSVLATVLLAGVTVTVGVRKLTVKELVPDDGA